MSALPCRIELASLEDLDALVELLCELFTIEQDFAPNTDAQRKGLSLLLEDRERAAVLVARDASLGRVIGMVTAQLVISTAEGAPSAWIEDLVVRQDCRASQVGRQLVEAVLSWAKGRGATRAQLLVDTDNAPAIGFYDHLGWGRTHLIARRVMI